MAKRVSLDTELVLVIEGTAEVKSRPLDMIIAPPYPGCVVFAFNGRHPATALEPGLAILAKLVVGYGIVCPGR